MEITWVLYGIIGRRCTMGNFKKVGKMDMGLN